MSLAERGSSRSLCSNQLSSSRDKRSERTGPYFPEPLRRGIAPRLTMFVLVLRIGSIVAVNVSVDDAVIMGVRVRMIVGVFRKIVLVFLHPLTSYAFSFASF